MKKTAIVMVLSLIAALFSVNVSAQEDYTPAREAQKLMAAIGVDMPEYTDMTAEITRGEFVYTLIQLLGAKNTDIAQYSFTDVSSEELAGVIGYAVTSGIVSDAELFYPDRAVTYSEAYKMGVVAVGYTLEAISMGGYPVGYTSAAISAGLAKNIRKTGDEPVSAYDFYVFMYNIATADIRVQSVYGDENKYEKIKGRSILSEYYDLVEISGIIDMDEYTSLYTDGIKCSSGHISVKSTDFVYSGKYTLGTNVKGYAKLVDGVYEILYIMPYKNNFVTVKADDITNVTESQLSYTDADDNTRKVKLSSSLAYIYNGKAYGRYTKDDLKISNGNIMFIDNDGDEVYDVAHVREGETAFVKKTDSVNKIIYDVNGDAVLDLSDDETEYKVFSGENEAKLRDIKENTIVSCYISKDRKLVNIVICSDKVSGTVSAAELGEEIIFIGGKQYKYNKYFEKYYLNNIVIGINNTFLLDDSGKIAAVSRNSSEMVYGYVLEVDTTEGFGNNLAVKIFTQRGTFEVLEFAEKVQMDGQNAANDTIKNKFGTGSDTKEQLVRYKVNSDNKITVIDTESETTGIVTSRDDDKNNLTRYSFTNYASSSATMRYKMTGIFQTYFAVNDNTVVIQISPSTNLDDEKRCSIISKSDFENDKQYTCDNVRAYNVSESGLASAILFIDGEGGGSNVSANSSHGIVDEVVPAVTAEGENAVRITIYDASADKFASYYLIDDSIWSSIGKAEASDKYPIVPGDYIRLCYSSDKEITAISKDYQWKGQKLLYTGSYNAILSYTYGGVYAEENNFYMLIKGNGVIDEAAITDANKQCINMKNFVAVFDTKTGRVTPSSLSEIVSYKQDSENYSTVLVRQRYADTTNIVIYK